MGRLKAWARDYTDTWKPANKKFKAKAAKLSPSELQAKEVMLRRLEMTTKSTILTGTICTAVSAVIHPALSAGSLPAVAIALWRRRCAKRKRTYIKNLLQRHGINQTPKRLWRDKVVPVVAGALSPLVGLGIADMGLSSGFLDLPSNGIYIHDFAASVNTTSGLTDFAHGIQNGFEMEMQEIFNADFTVPAVEVTHVGAFQAGFPLGKMFVDTLVSLPVTEGAPWVMERFGNPCAAKISASMVHFGWKCNMCKCSIKGVRYYCASASHNHRMVPVRNLVVLEMKLNLIPGAMDKEEDMYCKRCRKLIEGQCYRCSECSTNPSINARHRLQLVSETKNTTTGDALEKNSCNTLERKEESSNCRRCRKSISELYYRCTDKCCPIVTLKARHNLRLANEGENVRECTGCEKSIRKGIIHFCLAKGCRTTLCATCMMENHIPKNHDYSHLLACPMHELSVR
ncbi:hypothetical protein BDV93DRAFT_509094 [Ceratobasidium sp. AG-I]|nr:hypothetical protein BDV93DRAFT_509094 [Ceratobasidium sp. AG-I]